MGKTVKKITTDKAPAAIGPYSQGVVVEGNPTLIYVSGQLPIDPNTGAMIQGDIKALTKQVLDNLEAILLASSSSLQKVLRVEVFLTDLKRDFQGMNEEYAKRFNPQVPPARQTVQVAALHELEHDIGLSVDNLDRVGPDDVGVFAELGPDPAFRGEPANSAEFTHLAQLVPSERRGLSPPCIHCRVKPGGSLSKPAPPARRAAAS